MYVFSQSNLKECLCRGILKELNVCWQCMYRNVFMQRNFKDFKSPMTMHTVYVLMQRNLKETIPVVTMHVCVYTRKFYGVRTSVENACMCLCIGILRSSNLWWLFIYVLMQRNFKAFKPLVTMPVCVYEDRFKEFKPLMMMYVCVYAREF